MQVSTECTAAEDYDKFLLNPENICSFYNERSNDEVLALLTDLYDAALSLLKEYDTYLKEKQ